MTLAPRPWLNRVEPYRPGARAAGGDGSLASNESPLGTSPRVAAALRAAAGRVHRYPSPLADQLRERLGARHHVHPDQILVGNGSDELIFLLAWAYLAHGGRAVCADPAYRIDAISTHVVAGRLTQVPLRDWRHDLNAMARVSADIAYLVNPHNPTGTVCHRGEIERFVADSNAELVVVDEAYIDFTDDPAAASSLPLLATGKVAVLRTFSKLYGLAGLRVGYLIAPRDVIETLRKIRAPFSVSQMAQAGAIAAIQDADYPPRVRAHVLDYRARVTHLFQHAGYQVVPSQANFVLVLTGAEQDLVDRLAAHGVSVRPGTTLGVPGAVRVSVPSTPGLRLLTEALDEGTPE